MVFLVLSTLTALAFPMIVGQLVNSSVGEQTRFLENIDQRLSLFVILNVGFLAVSIKLHLVIQHFPELLVLINEHFQFILDFLIIILRIGRPIIVKFLDRLSEFRVDPDKFFQRLF